jgi:diketogulonate reductase-like aldo/keto reductase
MMDNRTNDNIGIGFGRRTFLKLMLAAGFASRWDTSKAVQSDSILKRPIPGSGEQIPVVGLGTSDEFETDNGQNLGPLREVLRRFVACGGTLVDTAPIYGNAETVIGNLVSELALTKQLFLATKVRTHGKQAGVEQLKRSTRLLKKRPLDLIQVHSLVDVDTQLNNLRRWQDAGHVRYIGITHSRVSAFEALERLMRNTKLDFVQLNYSFTEPNAEERLLPLAADRGIAVLANRPFENGAMFRRVKGKPLPEWAVEFDCKSWAQFSLKYILAHPAITCVIPATSDPDHLVDNMGAGVGTLPDARTRRLMREYVASL